MIHKMHQMVSLIISHETSVFYDWTILCLSDSDSSQNVRKKEKRLESILNDLLLVLRVFMIYAFPNALVHNLCIINDYLKEITADCDNHKKVTGYKLEKK